MRRGVHQKKKQLSYLKIDKSENHMASRQKLQASGMMVKHQDSGVLGLNPSCLCHVPTSQIGQVNFNLFNGDDGDSITKN